MHAFKPRSQEDRDRKIRSSSAVSWLWSQPGALWICLKKKRRGEARRSDKGKDVNREPISLIVLVTIKFTVLCYKIFVCISLYFTPLPDCSPLCYPCHCLDGPFPTSKGCPLLFSCQMNSITLWIPLTLTSLPSLSGSPFSFHLYRHIHTHINIHIILNLHSGCEGKCVEYVFLGLSYLI